MTKKAYRKTANPEYIQAMREIRRSNAAGTHQDTRDRRARTRQGALKVALKEYS
jgi:hypothetical protein